MRFIIAIKAFFAALFNRETASAIAGLLEAPEPKATAPAPESRPAPETPRTPATARSEALTLLSALQREARLIDLVHEELEKYSDAQIGAAARPCLQQCAGVINRLFELKPVVEAEEGQSIEVPADASPLRFQWIGESSGATGKVIHHGWAARKVELPQWSGSDAEAKIIAPAQVQAP